MVLRSMTRVLLLATAFPLCSGLTVKAMEHGELAPAAKLALSSVSPLDERRGNGSEPARSEPETNYEPARPEPNTTSEPARAEPDAMPRMYFHAFAPDELHILFYSWRPTSGVEYGFSLLFFFILAFSAEWLSYSAPAVLIEPLDPRKKRKLEGKEEQDSAEPAFGDMLIYKLAIFALVTTRLIGGFFLMLVVMSYDIGVFVVVVFGLALGYTLFADHQWFYGHAHMLGGPTLSARADHSH